MKINAIFLIASLVLAVVLCVVSIKTTNHNTERWTSVAAGFTVGALLLKAPQALTQKKKQQA